MGRAPAPTPHDERPLISVGICHHTGQLIHRCLESVRASQGVRYEILVCTSTQEAYPGCQMLYDQGGPAHKRNLLAQASQGSILVYLDDDVEVSPYCLYELWQGLDRPGVGMVFAKIRNMERRQELDDCGSWLTWTGFLWARAGNWQRDTGQYDTPQPILASKSATCAIWRRVFFDVGGFDASYFILGEETDLAWRCWLRGHHVWYWPAAVSWHAFNTTFKPKPAYYTLERIHYRGVRNYLSLLWTTLGTLRLLSILPIHLAVWTMALLGFALRGQWDRAQHLARGLWDFWTHLPHAKRRQVQASRILSDRDLQLHIAYAPPARYYVGRLLRYITQGLHG